MIVGIQKSSKEDLIGAWMPQAESCQIVSNARNIVVGRELVAKNGRQVEQ